MEYTYEEKIERVMNLRPIDDVFFEVLARDKDFDNEMLRLIMNDKDLTVTDVIVQSDERNLYGRSVRLDALCILGDGTKCNVEVQRSKKDDHLRRVRYNASMITVKDSETGTDFSEIPEVYVIYISEFDLFGGGKTIYHIEKVIRETGEFADDGLHEIFVNTTVDDGSELASYMSNFVKKEINSPRFPALTNAVNNLKNTEGGLSAVCEVMQKMIDEIMSEKDAALALKEAVIEEANRLLAERDKSLAEKDKSLAEKDKSLAEKDKSIEEKDTQLAAAYAKIKELESNK